LIAGVVNAQAIAGAVALSTRHWASAVVSGVDPSQAALRLGFAA
jgi:hypothetical protein